MITRRSMARAAAVSALSYSRILGANDRIGLGLVGAGGRGQYVMSLFQKNAEVEVRAICDVYAVKTDAAQQKAPGARAFTYHEKLLELKEVDAVLVGSPDHWHKDHTIDAMRAGKDVFVEKPLCRLREEAWEMVKEARIHERVCQVGVQQRSGLVYEEAREKYIRSGRIGKVAHVDAVWPSGAPRPLPTKPEAKPSNLDWVRFLGPVKYRDWVPGQYLNFRAFLDFNGGKMTDFGHHWMDVVHMFLGERGPVKVASMGGVFYIQDGRTAPDTISALFEYAGFTVYFASLASPAAGEYGITFHGDKGKLYVNRNRYEFLAAEKGAQPEITRYPGDITADHVRNFLDCCKSRKRPKGDVGLAAISIQPPLLAVQSYVEKRSLKYDPDREEVLPL
jgi:predicted dehydrogenase